MRRYVASRNLVNEEALAHWGLLKKKLFYYNNTLNSDANIHRQLKRSNVCENLKLYIAEINNQH